MQALFLVVFFRTTNFLLATGTTKTLKNLIIELTKISVESFYAKEENPP